MKVTKRNGTQVAVDFEKIHKVLKWSCEGIEGVSATRILLKTQIALFDGISTKDIHKTLIRAASDLVFEDVDYTYVASRLANYMLYKDLFGCFEKPTLREQYDRYVERFYTTTLASTYTQEEWDYLNTQIEHDRDFKIPYSGFVIWESKYLVKDKETKVVYETPQFAIMLLSMKIFEASKTNRLKKVVDYYNAVSTFKINVPTPILAGVRTKKNQYSSCVLIDCGDSIDSIFASSGAVGKYIANLAGIGINMSRVRSIGSPIRNGEAEHTGKIPFLRLMESSTASCSQGNIRKGSSTAFVSFWDYEITDLLKLKSNKGIVTDKVRKIDYGVLCCKLFYDRFLKNQNITLFSTSEVPGLFEAFGDNDEFERLYILYENNPTIRKKQIPARELMSMLATERFETGRYYIINIDTVNEHSSFLEKIRQSNLCVEVTLPTKPFETLTDRSGEIALCVLSAICAGVAKLDELENLMALIVESLDNVVEMQSYLLPQTEYMKLRRSLGIGLTNVAGFFALNECEYGSQKSRELLDTYIQHMTYYGIKASVELAKERGACEYFDKTKYSKGLLPIHTRNTKIDEVFKHVDKVDWEGLAADVMKYGMRNSTLFAGMPCETSAQANGSTNGFEPIRDYIIAKQNKTSGVMRTVAPNYKTHKQYYTLAFDVKNSDINILTAIVQKYFDQAISVNHYYKKQKGQDKIQIKDVISDILTFYKYGGKNLYYSNTYDEKTDKFDDEPQGCESGACSI